jgi:hypothetical protein
MSEKKYNNFLIIHRINIWERPLKKVKSHVF